MKIIKLITLLLFILSISACHKDEDESNIINTTVPSTKVVEEIKGGIVGYVYDEYDQPVENASVLIYSGSTMTDKYGMFRFNNVNLDKLGTYIKVEKKGFIVGSDFVYPSESTVYSYVNLLSLSKTGEFVAKEGGVVKIEGGGEVIFPANGIVKEDGTLYNGKVIVTAKRLAQNDEQIQDKMPGTLRGETIDGKSVILGTLGMVVVELRDEAGNELNIKSGSSATISLPVLESSLTNAPTEIPFWAFDENKGLWIEEGKAILQDGNYIGEASHFTWWNLDAKFDPIYMCVNVKFTNGEPAAGYIVALTADVIYPTSIGYTDENGRICGLVPKGKEMVMEIRSTYCSEIIVSKVIGPFDNDVELDEIVIDDEIFVGGKVACDGEVEPNAIVVLKVKTLICEITYIAISDQDGRFSFSKGSVCSATPISIFAYNSETGDASKLQLLDGNTNNENLFLDICSSCSYNVDMVWEYGDMCDASTLTLEAKISESGDYNYIWSNGESGSKIGSLSSGTYCVTITENTSGCEKVKCVNYNSYGGNLEFEGGGIKHPTCGKENGKLFIPLYGGIPPYTISIEGPDGAITVQDTFILPGMKEGIYKITATDAAGCSISRNDTLIMDKNHEVNLTYFNGSGCEKTTIIARVSNASSNDLEYKWSNGQKGWEIEVTTPGEYCVTVTEDGDCEISACIDVEMLESAEDVVLQSCDKNIYTYYSKDDVTVILGNEFQNYFDQTFEVDVLQFGYYFSVEPNPEKYCNNRMEVMLPSLADGITIDSTHNTSCETCNDGQIFFTVNSTNDCNDCTYGNYAVYAIDDLNTDLTSENEAGNLASGEYYIFVYDANSGCLIAHETVTINQGGDCLSSELKEGILLFYPFSNGGIEDMSGNNRHLFSVGSVSSTSDRFGNNNCAKEFSKGFGPSYLVLKDTIFLETLEDFSISLWYQPLGDRDAGEFESLFERGNISGDGNLVLGLYDCRKAMFSWTTSCWDDENYFGCDKAMQDHEWHHLVGTYDSGSREMKLYRNGVLQESRIGNFTPINDGLLYLGSGFTGKLDDVIFYGRTLNSDEVLELKNAGSCCN